jgi:hypothetical protein
MGMLTPDIEHEGSDMSQFDIDILVEQSTCETQSGGSQGSSTDDMLCGCSWAIESTAATFMAVA